MGRITTIPLGAAVSSCITGGIEGFSASKNIRKILKVSHPRLEFSWSENYNKIKYSKRVSLEFSGSHRILLELSIFGSKKSNETLWKCLISLSFFV